MLMLQLFKLSFYVLCGGHTCNPSTREPTEKDCMGLRPAWVYKLKQAATIKTMTGGKEKPQVKQIARPLHWCPDPISHVVNLHSV